MTRTSQALPTLLSQAWFADEPAPIRRCGKFWCVHRRCAMQKWNLAPNPAQLVKGGVPCLNMNTAGAAVWPSLLSHFGESEHTHTHRGLTRWFVVALYDCLLLEDSCGCCCFSSRRLSDGPQCIWISSQVLWTLRARGGRCWSSSVDSLRLQNLSGRVWPAQQVESTWYV